MADTPVAFCSTVHNQAGLNSAKVRHHSDKTHQPSRLKGELYCQKLCRVPIHNSMQFIYPAWLQQIITAGEYPCLLQKSL